MDKKRVYAAQSLRKYFLNFVKWIIGCLYLSIGAPGCKSKIIAFVVHEVGDKPRDHARLTSTYSTKKNFLKQISLLSNYFDFLDPSKDPLWVNKTGCLITFDDGYRGSLDAALVLESKKISSIHLINLESINMGMNSSAVLHFSSIESGKKLDWADSTPKNFEILMNRLTKSETKRAFEFSGPYLELNELKALSSLSCTVVGDHFLNHFYGNSLTEDEIVENLILINQESKSIVKISPYFAAPHGKLDNSRIKHISTQGYEVIFSGSSWIKVGSTHVIPRIDLNNSIRSKFSLFGAIAILLLRSKTNTRS
jgi:hypothetical protein